MAAYSKLPLKAPTTMSQSNLNSTYIQDNQKQQNESQGYVQDNFSYDEQIVGNQGEFDHNNDWCEGDGEEIDEIWDRLAFWWGGFSWGGGLTGWGWWGDGDEEEINPISMWKAEKKMLPQPLPISAWMWNQERHESAVSNLMPTSSIASSINPPTLKINLDSNRPSP